MASLETWNISEILVLVQMTYLDKQNNLDFDLIKFQLPRHSNVKIENLK